jgi:hypothetical protein
VVHTGLSTPFSPGVFLEGLGRMANATIGLFDGPFDLMAVSLVISIIAACSIGLIAFATPRWRPFYVLAIFGLPLLHAALRLPNQQGSRFHLTSAIALALLCAEAWARAWPLRGTARFVALAAALGFFTGQTGNLSKFLAFQRGHFADATAFMRKGGPASFMVLPPVALGETAAVIRWYGGGEGPAAGLKPVTAAEPCPAEADWLLIVHHPNESRETGGTQTVGPSACPARFDYIKTFPSYGLSGFTWVLFRRIR